MQPNTTCTKKRQASDQQHDATTYQKKQRTHSPTPLLDHLRTEVFDPLTTSDDTLRHLSANFIHHYRLQQQKQQQQISTTTESIEHEILNQIEFVKISQFKTPLNNHGGTSRGATTTHDLEESEENEESEQPKRQQKKKVLIGRIVPRFQTKVHIASLFFTQSDPTITNNSNNSNESDEIVCQVIANNSTSNDDDNNNNNHVMRNMLTMSYLHHWFMFYDCTHVPSHSIITM